MLNPRPTIPFLGVFLAALLVVAATLPAVAQVTKDYEFVDKIKKGDYHAVQMMVLDHINLNARSVDGTPALIVAVENGDPMMVSLLLDAGANPDIADRRSGELALTYAAGRNNTDIVARLLKAGANPNAANKQYETALIRAVNNSNSAIIRLLMAAGADPEAQDYTGHSARWYAENGRNRGLVKLLDTPSAVAKSQP